MAVSSSCCSLRRFSPPPPPAACNLVSLPSRSTQISWPRKERSWGSQCVLGLACAMIGLQMGNFALDQSETAMAGEIEIRFGAESKPKVEKWSEKRSCQPWRMNSLENIVPENLPRPSARRRWEIVGFSDDAPLVKVATKSDAKNCFSL